VLGNSRGPCGGAGGVSQLPNSGQGSEDGGMQMLLGLAVMAVAGAGVTGFAWKARRR
jgi:hypothetical protein